MIEITCPSCGDMFLTETDPSLASVTAEQAARLTAHHEQPDTLTQCTPDPWIVDESPDARRRGYIRTADGRAVARATSAGRGYSEMVANARLIAAAPLLVKKIARQRALIAQLVAACEAARETITYLTDFAATTGLIDAALKAAREG